MWDDLRGVFAMYVMARGRSDVQHIMVTITDGYSSKPWLTEAYAMQARDEKIKMYALAVGSGYSQSGLEQIASFPKDSHIFLAQNYLELKSLEYSVLHALCSKYLKF